MCKRPESPGSHSGAGAAGWLIALHVEGGLYSPLRIFNLQALHCLVSATEKPQSSRTGCWHCDIQCQFYPSDLSNADRVITWACWHFSRDMGENRSDVTTFFPCYFLLGCSAERHSSQNCTKEDYSAFIEDYSFVFWQSSVKQSLFPLLFACTLYLEFVFARTLMLIKKQVHKQIEVTQMPQIVYIVIWAYVISTRQEKSKNDNRYSISHAQTYSYTKMHNILFVNCYHGIVSPVLQKANHIFHFCSVRFLTKPVWPVPMHSCEP